MLESPVVPLFAHNILDEIAQKKYCHQSYLNFEVIHSAVFSPNYFNFVKNKKEKLIYSMLTFTDGEGLTIAGPCR